ncbi:MAG: CDP-glycerol glycerophosphotransferase family protein [Actinomycetota bacterium]|nr:CDP-glycerol glycerophosphotransferase family protein [Actinomycetota bacterium]
MTTALFEAWRGGYADSPARLSELMGERNPEVHRVWVAGKGALLPPGVHGVRRHSPAHLARLATADLLVSNDIVTRGIVGPRTVYVQTWHGTPLKLLGFDEVNPVYPGAAAHLARVRRDVHRWNYLVSPSPVCTELFRSAFHYDGQVLEIGYPRNDVLSGAGAAVRRAELRNRLGVGDRTVVLYVPTWRDDARSVWAEPEVEKLMGGLPSDLVLWARSHPNDRHVPPHPSVADLSAWPDVADLFLAADVLLGDYSSAIFDFAVTGKPIVSFVPDLARYTAQRGMYFDYLRWAPGPVAHTAADALDAILAQEIDQPKYDRFVSAFCPYEDGRAGMRLYDLLTERLGLASS